MSDVVINIDDPEVIITDEYSTDYDLPIASNTTLGGVKIGDHVDIESDGTITIPVASVDTAGVIKVGANLSIDENGVLSGQAGGSVTIDSTLSTVSTNPVQNRVITNTINSLSSDIGATQSSVAGLNDDFETLAGTVTTLGTTVASQGNTLNSLSTTVSENTGNISTLNSTLSTATLDITNLDNRLDTAEDNITTQGDDISTIQGDIAPLIVTFLESVNGIDIDNTIWTDGKVTIYRKGDIGTIYLTLEGSYTLQSASSKLVYTMSDRDNLPITNACGVLYTNEGVIYAELDTDGKLIIYNYGNQNITLSYLMGSFPIIFN